MASRKKIYIIILVFFLIAVFLILFFVYPIFKEIQENYEDLISGKNDFFIMAEEFSEVENFRQKYEEYKANLEKTDNLFVDSQNPVEFIKFLEKTASDAGVNLEISSPSFSQGDKFSLIIFRLSSYGDFSKNLSFIRKLETGPYLIGIKNLDIGRYKDIKNLKEQSENLKIVFLVNVFAK
jgi:hypothetical protein